MIDSEKCQAIGSNNLFWMNEPSWSVADCGTTCSPAAADEASLFIIQLVTRGCTIIYDVSINTPRPVSQHCFILDQGKIFKFDYCLTVRNRLLLLLLFVDLLVGNH